MARKPRGWRKEGKRHATAARKGWKNRVSRRRGDVVLVGASNRTHDLYYRAKKAGKRRSKHGKTYYEYRRNRSDRHPRTRL